MTAIRCSGKTCQPGPFPVPYFDFYFRSLGSKGNLSVCRIYTVASCFECMCLDEAQCSFLSRPSLVTIP